VNYSIIDCYNIENDLLLKQMCKLHYEALSYRSFITNFGEKFLFTMYKLILKKSIGFIAIAKKEDELAGFTLNVFNSSKLFPLILWNFLLFLPTMMPVLLKNPSLIKKTLLMALYGSKKNCEIQAELLVIIVNESLRSQGVGEELIKNTNIHFGKKGIVEYIVTVHAVMTQSNNFYKKVGMLLDAKHSFSFLGSDWNVYVNRLNTHEK